MKLVGFFGDTHGQLRRMWHLAQEWQDRTELALDCIFQVGDFGAFPNEEGLDPASRRYAEKHGQSIQEAVGDFPSVLSGDFVVPLPTYFIRGNHSNQEFLLGLHKRQEATASSLPIEVVTNLFYVPDGCVFRRAGVRFAGWGGNFSYKTWSQGLGYWDPRRTGRRLNHMTKDVFEKLSHSEFEVLLTHDGPSGIGLVGKMGVGLPGEEMTGGGVPYIRQLIEEKQPLFSLSGHWHEYHKAQIGRSTHYALHKIDPFTEPELGFVVVEL